LPESWSIVSDNFNFKLYKDVVVYYGFLAVLLVLSVGAYLSSHVRWLLRRRIDIGRLCCCGCSSSSRRSSKSGADGDVNQNGQNVRRPSVADTLFDKAGITSPTSSSFSSSSSSSIDTETTGSQGAIASTFRSWFGLFEHGATVAELLILLMVAVLMVYWYLYWSVFVRKRLENPANDQSQGKNFCS
jgi:hypothetical protein